MRTLIILRGLSRFDKDSWLKKEKLLNFSIELETLKRLFYKPEYKGGRDFLIRSLDDLVYRRMIEILISRMNGSLVVLDWGTDSTAAIEQLARVLGYTVFYKVFSVPKDYLTDPKRYQDPRYLPKSKDQLKEEVESFKKEDYSDKLLINTYEDLEKYWESATPIFKVRDRSSVIHVSDIHSHWTIVRDIIIPKIVHKGLTIFLGDYIDGPNSGGSREVMEFIMREQRDNVIFLEGNHEQRLRKFLGWKALKGNKRIVSESLYSEIPPDFLEHTAKEFDDLTAADAWNWLDELNGKLHEFFIYERQGYRFICSHCGLKWAEQVCPKYVGSLLSTNRHIEKTDEFFSKRYSEKKVWSIHGHCHYSGYEFNKFPGVFNIDPPDENKVIIMEGKPNLKFNIRCLEQDN